MEYRFKADTYKTITEEEIAEWCRGTISDFTKDRLLRILNGEYDLAEAREDVLSFRKKPEDEE